MPDNLPSINLIKNKQAPLVDKFINWALTIGRLIVILTEAVALSAFIYRFSLDEKLIDLHSAIKQKQAIISVLKQEENKYRNLQDRIALATTFAEKSVKTNRIIVDITNFIPPGMLINNLKLNNNRLNIGINANSVSQLTNFVDSLKGYREIQSISIDGIENNSLAGLLANLTIIVK